MRMPRDNASISLWRVYWRELGRFRALSWPAIRGLLIDTYADWSLHKAPRLGAALAFYTMLSLAPLLVVLVTIVGFLYGQEAAQGKIAGPLSALLGRDGALAVQTLLKTTHRQQGGVLASILGSVTLFLSATTVVAELRDALNTIWDVVPAPTNSSWMDLSDSLRQRSYAFALVLGTGVLLLASLLLNTAIAAVYTFAGHWIPLPQSASQAIDFALSFLLVTALFGMLFKTLPDISLRWRDVTVGAVGTALLFTIGRFFIGLYLGHTGVTSAYGAAGSLALVLIWVYYSAQVFFFGATFTKIYAHRYGSQR